MTLEAQVRLSPTSGDASQPVSLLLAKSTLVSCVVAEIRMPNLYVGRFFDD